jgi:hypothetical protein
VNIQEQVPAKVASTTTDWQSPNARTGQTCSLHHGIQLPITGSPKCKSRVIGPNMYYAVVLKADTLLVSASRLERRAFVVHRPSVAAKTLDNQSDC